MRFPKMVHKSILHKQMAEKLAIEVSCSDGDEQMNRMNRQLFSKILIQIIIDWQYCMLKMTLIL